MVGSAEQVGTSFPPPAVKKKELKGVTEFLDPTKTSDSSATSSRELHYLRTHFNLSSPTHDGCTSATVLGLTLFGSLCLRLGRKGSETPVGRLGLAWGRI